MNRRHLLAALPALPLAALTLAACLPPAHAQGFDLAHGGPVAITARGGFTLNQTRQTATAYGDARAVRGDVTILADKLVAHYRRKPGTSPASAASNAGANAGSSNEVYRLEAIGHVRIFTPTDTAVADRAVYDMDQAVLVMTGGHLRLTTPRAVLTARDSMEYWSDKHMAVARGDATATASDGRQVRADVLVAYTKPSAPQPPGAPAASVTPAGAATPAAAATGTPQAGALEKVEAFGHVVIRNAQVVATGDRGVYLPATGQARLIGHVRITRGENQLNGPAADVNLKTGIAQLVADPGARVSGMLTPQSRPPATRPPTKGAKP